MVLTDASSKDSACTSTVTFVYRTCFVVLRQTWPRSRLPSPAEWSTTEVKRKLIDVAIHRSFIMDWFRAGLMRHHDLCLLRNALCLACLERHTRFTSRWKLRFAYVDAVFTYIRATSVFIVVKLSGCSWSVFTDSCSRFRGRPFRSPWHSQKSIKLVSYYCWHLYQ